MSSNEKGFGGLKDQLKKLFGIKPKTVPHKGQASRVATNSRKRQSSVRQSEALKRNQNRVQLASPQNRNTSELNQEKRTRREVGKKKQIGKSLPAGQEKLPDEESGLDVYQRESSVAIQQRPAVKSTSLLMVLGDPWDIRASRVFLEHSSGELAPNLLHQRDCWNPVPTERRLTNPRVLRLGLDMGTSATKVVVMDSARAGTAWAVPFFKAGSNLYLLPTAISWRDDSPFISGHSNALKPFKWRLISNQLNRDTFVDATAYLALVLRHTVAWLNKVHGDYYRPDSLVWEIRVGLPAESNQGSELCYKYKALLSSAIAIASMKGRIHKSGVEKEVDFILSEIELGNEVQVDRHFVESGMLLPAELTPEIAANIAGFYRSRKWDHERPYGLLMDVGASTLDCAFCSFRDHDDNVALSEFTRSVEMLGVFRLHEMRVQWILDGLEAQGETGDNIVSRLLDELTSIAFDQAIPSRIQNYLENAEIEDESVDRDFKSRLADSVASKNLIPGIKKCFRGVVQPDTVIPVYLSGGGSRHKVFKSYLQDHSHPPNASWSLQVERLGIPDFVEAPGIQVSDRDRLTVAYGLCADENWKVNNPDKIEKFVPERKDFSDNFISKDQV